MTSVEINEWLGSLTVKRLRAEVVVEELVAAGFCRAEEVVLVPERSTAKFFERDVSAIEAVTDLSSGRIWHRAASPRGGFYDALPERLFHRPIPRSTDAEDWEEIREEETQQETEARLFFLPFDSQLNRQRIALERFERRVLAGQDDGFLREFVRAFWPEAEGLDLSAAQRQSLFWLTVMAHRVAGDLPAMEVCFSEFLDDAVRIIRQDGEGGQAVDFDLTPLGDLRLGEDEVLAVDFFAEGQWLSIEVGPLSYERMSAYFPGERGEKILEFLCHLLVPAELSCEVMLVPKLGLEEEVPASETPISFSIHDNGKQAVLGYTSLLG